MIPYSEKQFRMKEETCKEFEISMIEQENFFKKLDHKNNYLLFNKIHAKDIIL